MEVFMKMYFAVLQLADVAKVSREAAYGLVQFLQAKNMVRFYGTLKKEMKSKGRGQIVYEMTLETSEIQMTEIFQELKKYENAPEINSPSNPPPAAETSE
jgi:hypothetical protein